MPMRFPVEEALDITQGLGTHDCHKFRERIFRAHEFLCLALAQHYKRTAINKGYVDANRELGRFNKRLTLGKKYQGLSIVSPDEAVKDFAELRSLTLSGSFHNISKRQGVTAAVKAVIRRVDECDLSFPLDNPLEASEAELSAALARCFDPGWWRRQIRRRQDTIIEHVLIELGLVNKRKGIYASNFSVERKLKQWQRNEELLASLEAENDLGQVFNLLDLAKRGMANLTNRRNELMTRIAGFEAIAKDREDVGVFYTLTAPSKYHSQLASTCQSNPKYFGASPADTHAYLNKVWQRVRAKLKRLQIDIYGVRVVEPHHDGTPHWHLLLFIKPSDAHAVTQVFAHYALEEDGNEPGARKSRLKVETIDPAKGSAVGYIAKYIAKNIDGEHVGADLYGMDAIESATRIRAWASTWNIRQFQAIGGPSVTVWREARHFANSEYAEKVLERIDSENLATLIQAADSGDWRGFVELSGGPTAPREEQPLRALHVIKESLNKYGEEAKKLLGIIHQGSRAIRTKIREWVVRPVKPAARHQAFNEDFSIGGANAPPLEFCQ